MSTCLCSLVYAYTQHNGSTHNASLMPTTADQDHNHIILCNGYASGSHGRSRFSRQRTAHGATSMQLARCIFDLAVLYGLESRRCSPASVLIQ